MKKHKRFFVFYTIFLVLIGFNLVYLIYKLFNPTGCSFSSIILTLVVTNMIVMSWRNTIETYRKKVLKIKEEKKNTKTEWAWAIAIILFTILTITYFIIEFWVLR